MIMGSTPTTTSERKKIEERVVKAVPVCMQLQNMQLTIQRSMVLILPLTPGARKCYL
jgi:hypothetical protein